MSDEPVLQEVSRLPDRTIKVFMSLLGIAIIAGSLWSTLADARTDINALKIAVPALQLQQELMKAEQKKNIEFAELIQEENEEDHEAILQAIRDLSERI